MPMIRHGARGSPTCTTTLLLAVLLLVVMPSATGAAVAAKDDDTTVSSFVDYFVGDLFVQYPSNMPFVPGQKAPPRFRPWRLIDVPNDSVLAFDCKGHVPTLHVVPNDDNNLVEGSPPPTDNTCGVGGPQAAGTTTPTQYKFRFLRPGGNGDDMTAGEGFSALFWERPTAGEEEEDGGAMQKQLMPVPKFQLKAMLKGVAAMMDASWRKERSDGGEAVPAEEESSAVDFSDDMVVFYFEFKEGRWLVAMGREDVLFLQPWEKLHGKIQPLNLGAVV